MFNKNEITLRVHVIYISFWKGQLSQYDSVKETFVSVTLLEGEFSRPN